MARGARSISAWMLRLATSGPSNSRRADKATARCCQTCLHRSPRRKKSARSRPTAPMTPDDAMAQSLIEGPKRTSPSAGTVAPGKRIARPHASATTSCTGHDTWDEPTGSVQSATASEVGRGADESPQGLRRTHRLTRPGSTDCGHPDTHRHIKQIQRVRHGRDHSRWLNAKRDRIISARSQLAQQCHLLQNSALRRNLPLPTDVRPCVLSRRCRAR